MAERILVKDVQIDAGRQTLAALDKAKIPVDAAYWILRESDWEFCIHTDLLEKLSKSGVYKKIQGALRRAESPMRLRDITLVSSRDEYLQALRSMVRISGGGWTSVTSSTLLGVYIEDAVVYRMQ